MPSLIVKTQPAVEPISLAEAKNHLNVTIADDDALIQSLIKASRATLERQYDIAFITQSLVLGRDYFPAVFGMGWGWSPGWWLGNTWMAQYDTQELRYGFIGLRPPASAITTVTYLDPTGAATVWPASNYILDPDSRPSRFSLALGKVYPVTAPLLGAVKIEFVTGYPDAASVPEDLKEAVKLMVGEYYQNRENVVIDSRIVAIEVPDGVDALMVNFAPALIR